MVNNGRIKEYNNYISFEMDTISNENYDYMSKTNEIYTLHVRRENESNISTILNEQQVCFAKKKQLSSLLSTEQATSTAVMYSSVINTVQKLFENCNMASKLTKSKILLKFGNSKSKLIAKKTTFIQCLLNDWQQKHHKISTDFEIIDTNRTNSIYNTTTLKLPCSYYDNCRCIDCQSSYFDCDCDDDSDNNLTDSSAGSDVEIEKINEPYKPILPTILNLISSKKTHKNSNSNTSSFNGESKSDSPIATLTKFSIRQICYCCSHCRCCSSPLY